MREIAKIDLNHTAAMLSPEGLKTFVLAQPKLAPKHFNSRPMVRNLLSMANVAGARIRPIVLKNLTFLREGFISNSRGKTRIFTAK